MWRKTGRPNAATHNTPTHPICPLRLSQSQFLLDAFADPWNRWGTGTPGPPAFLEGYFPVLQRLHDHTVALPDALQARKRIPVRLEGPLQLFTSSPRHGGKTRVPRAVHSRSHSGTCFTVAAAREALEFRSSSGDISFLSSGHFQGCDPGVLPGASTESAPHGLTLTSRVPQLSALNHILRGLS